MKLRLIARTNPFPFAALLLASAAQAAAPAKPNIVVILADDYGWGSVGCYGAKGVKTPHLDRLAQEGRRFTHAYAPGSVCSPTRYGLMTGRYYWRTPVKDGRVLPANSPLHIETNRLTLASLCRSQGYRTAGFGKWHLGLTTERVTDWSKPLVPGPLQVGFDYFYGTVSEQVICHTDLLATFARVLQAPLPKGNAEDSFDVLRAFTEARPGAPVRDHVILQAADATYAIRAGDWKLVERASAPPFESVRNKRKTEQAAKKKKNAPKQDELFLLKADPAETNDVIAANAERAAKMKQLLAESRDRGFTRPGAGN